MRKWLCVVLAAAMLLSLLPVGASAEEAFHGYLVGVPALRLQAVQAVDADMTYVRENLYYVDSAADVAALQKAGLVDYYEPNYPIELMDARWNMQAVHAPAVWSHQDAQGTYDRRGSGVTVAVIDSGVVPNNSDFFPGQVLPYYDLCDNPVGVDIWHGTFVAGLIGAQVENGVGIDGAASAVNLLPICITKEGKSDIVTAIQAIDYAVKQGVDVINLSIGGSKTSTALKRACQDAVNAGVILVAAAGNYEEDAPQSARNYMYPAGYDFVVGVSGCKQTEDGTMVFDSSYSYYNNQVNVCAPGSKVTSLYMNLGTASATGTSFATPIVSSMAAIAKQCNPAIGQETFMTLLEATATDLGEPGYDMYYGAGLVNMEAFCDALAQEYPIYYYSGDAPAEFAEEVPHTYTIADPTLTLPQPVRTGYRFLGWYETPALTGKPVTELPTASIGERRFYAAWQKLPNGAPTVTPQAAAQGKATPASRDGVTPAVPYTADIALWFADPEGDALTYRLTEPVGTLNGTLLSYTPAISAANTEISLHLQAEDSHGARSAVHTVTVQVSAVPNSAPTLLDAATQVYAAPPSADGRTPAIPLYAEVSRWFTDPDGDRLQYKLLDGVGELGGEALTYTPTADDGGKTYPLHLQAEDPSGAKSPILTLTLMISERTNSAPTVTAAAPQEISITPASLDGATPAVAYRADVADWFTDADGEALRYALVSGPGSLVGTTLTVYPDAASANSVQTLCLQAVDAGNAASPVLTVAVHVGALPVSQSVLLEPSVSLNLCDLPQELRLPLTLYGNRVTAAKLDAQPMAWRMEGESLLVEVPTGLSLGQATLSIEFDAGEAVTCLWRITRDCPSAAFTDVPLNAWYHSAVDFTVQGGLMQGVGSGKFAPDRTFTRAMLVTVLYRMAGEPPQGSEQAFLDVPAGKWYTDAVAWAADRGIVNGVSPGKFAPDAPVTREQMVTILFRYAGDDGVRASLAGFPDASRVSTYAREAMAWAIGHGIVSGISSQGRITIAPQGEATRAQVATILMRFLKEIAP